MLIGDTVWTMLAFIVVMLSVGRYLWPEEVMIGAVAEMTCPLKQSSHFGSYPHAFGPILAKGSARAVSAT